MKGKSILKILIAVLMTVSLMPTNVYAAVTDLTADSETAISGIVFPKWEDGTDKGVKVSELLKAKLDTGSLTLTQVEEKYKVEFQIKNLYLSSDYLNGKSPAGMSFYNMVNLYIDLHQLSEIMTEKNIASILDKNDKEVTIEYVNEMLGLVKQIITIDPTTNLKFDYDSAYDTDAFQNNTLIGGTDVIATSKEGNVTFKFHIDSHGWWGYDLGADDSITSLVMGFDQDAINADRAERESPITKQFGHFFVLEMKNAASGKWYMLNGTDLENPILYVSADKKEAFMIDVDMYGKNVLNHVIKSVIGPECESLKVFFTHNHGDHVNNLEIMMKDEFLKDIITVYWPENEPTVKVVDDFKTAVDAARFVTIKDQQVFEAAGVQFKFNEILDEHTPGGGQLADLTNGILFSGDTLGAQVHLGGTTVGTSGLDSWHDAMVKTEKFIEDNELDYIIGGHTPYLNTPEFATWIKVAIEYAQEKVEDDQYWKGGLVIVENGKVVTNERMGQMFGEGLTDREELFVGSVNFRGQSKPQDPPAGDDQGGTGEGTEKPETPEKPKEPIKTGDEANITLWASAAAVALGGLVLVSKKRKESEE